MTFCLFCIIFSIFTSSTLISRYMGRKGLLISGLLLLYIVMFMTLNNLLSNWNSMLSTHWTNMYTFQEYYSLQLNTILTNYNSIFIVSVDIISILIIIYTFQYLIIDKHLIRIIVFLWMFLTSMNTFILSSSYIVLFTAWEIFGFISGILVKFWKNDPTNINNALKALIINRIGDYFLSLSLYYITSITGSDIFINWLLESNVYNMYNSRVVLSLFNGLSILSKSAQFPFWTWLYDAMSAPTPVSSLLHAATMVTAGAYLAITILTNIQHQWYIPYYIIFIFIFVIISYILTSIMSYNNNDIKRILAFSTSGQLGIIIMGILLNNVNQSYIHLISHAYFKALLFLSVANLIHSFYDNQDIRYYGIQHNTFPSSILSIQFGSLSMIGFWYLSGFYSKENIISQAFYNTNYLSYIVYIILSIGTIFTVAYTFKLIKYIVNNYNSVSYLQNIGTHSVDLIINIVYSILIFISLFIIAICSSLNIVTTQYLIDSHTLYNIYNSLPVFCILFALFITFINIDSPINSIWYIQYSNRLSWDYINLRISANTLYYSYSKAFKLIDKQLLPWISYPGNYLNNYNITTNAQVYNGLIVGFVITIFTMLFITY